VNKKQTQDLVELRRKLTIKYGLDRLVGFVLLLLTSPLILILAVLIKIEGWIYPLHRGPAFYMEPRVSEGRIFPMVKFRTVPMKVVAWIREKPESRSITTARQEWTFMGKVILTWYLDELPQLWNMAKGDMSMIGPRPDLAAYYEEDLKRGYEFRKILKGGLLGIPQACKRNKAYRLYFEEMAREVTPRTDFMRSLDELYYQRLMRDSPAAIFFFDLEILAKSLRTVFVGERKWFRPKAVKDRWRKQQKK